MGEGSNSLKAPEILSVVDGKAARRDMWAVYADREGHDGDERFGLQRWSAWIVSSGFQYRAARN